MTDGQRQRVGGVGGPRRIGDAQQSHHHRRDLILVRPPVPGHGRLDLSWGVQRHGQAPAGRADDRYGARLSRPHHRAHVQLAENALHGHRIGTAGIEPRLDISLNRQQPCRDVVGS